MKTWASWFAGLVLIFCLAGSLSGQQSASPNSSGSAGTSASQDIYWDSNDPRCSHWYVRGELYRQITANGITVALTLRQSRFKLLEAEAVVINSDLPQLDIGPDTFGALVPRVTAAGASQDEVLEQTGPEEIGKRIKHRAMWRAMAVGAMGGAASARQTTSTSNVDVSGTATDQNGNVYDVHGSGTATTTTVYTDQESMRKTNEATDAIHRRAQDDINTVGSMALPRSTLFKGKDMAGVVWFKPPKEKFYDTLLVGACFEPPDRGCFVFPFSGPQKRGKHAEK